jgi:hypothetical protein
MILLSKVAHLLITPASTFGGTASLLGYMAPLYVTVSPPYPEQIVLEINGYSVVHNYSCGLQKNHWSPIHRDVGDNSPRLQCEEASIANGPGGKMTNTVLW